MKQTQTHLPNYAEVDQILSKTTLKLHPSQVHGLICGVLCGHLPGDKTWGEVVTGDKKLNNTHKLLQELYDVSAKQLEDYLFDFQILLPLDTTTLPERAEALTLWAQGFLTGLKLAQVRVADCGSHEAIEAVNDITEIAKMNYEDVIANEEDENAYVELVEYIRMAVILVYQDLQDKETGNSNKYLH